MESESCARGERTREQRREPAASDPTLARAVLDGDRDAWVAFYHRYFNWIYRFAYHHAGRSHADAEDLTSEILMTAVRNIGRYDATRGDLDAWLLGVAKHCLGHHCRRRRKELPVIPEVLAEHADQEIENEPSFEDQVLVHDAVNRALAALPSRQADALIDKYVEGYSVEEIARIGETTPKAVESLLSRARASFRIALTKLLEPTERGR